MRPLCLEIEVSQYVLHQDLSFCEVGGRLVFLDVGSDQYLRLPLALEAALVSYLSGDPAPDIDVNALVARNILVERTADVTDERSTVPSPARSAMEAARPARRISLIQALEVVFLVAHTQLLLKLRPFKKVLQTIGGAPSAADGRPPTRQVSEEAAVFRRVRLFVPVGMRCLVDSVALARYLRRRKHRVHVVFGVAVDPFSAHCWVQAGDVVLNDTLGNVTSHTPLRVV